MVQLARRSSGRARRCGGRSSLRRERRQRPSNATLKLSPDGARPGPLAGPCSSGPPRGRRRGPGPASGRLAVPSARCHRRRLGAGRASSAALRRATSSGARSIACGRGAPTRRTRRYPTRRRRERLPSSAARPRAGGARRASPCDWPVPARTARGKPWPTPRPILRAKMQRPRPRTGSITARRRSARFPARVSRRGVSSAARPAAARGSGCPRGGRARPAVPPRPWGRTRYASGARAAWGRACTHPHGWPRVPTAKAPFAACSGNRGPCGKDNEAPGFSLNRAQRAWNSKSIWTQGPFASLSFRMLTSDCKIASAQRDS